MSTDGFWCVALVEASTHFRMRVTSDIRATQLAQMFLVVFPVYLSSWTLLSDNKILWVSECAGSFHWIQAFVFLHDILSLCGYATSSKAFFRGLWKPFNASTRFWHSDRTLTGLRGIHPRSALNSNISGSLVVPEFHAYSAAGRNISWSAIFLFHLQTNSFPYTLFSGRLNFYLVTGREWFLLN